MRRAFPRAAALMLVWMAGEAGGTQGLVTLGTVKTASLSMGGACTAVRSDLTALDFNPAAFTLDPFGAETRPYVFLNPLAPAIWWQNRKTVTRWSVPAGWIVRGIGCSVGRVDIGVLFGEESLKDRDRLVRKRLFNADGYALSRNTSFGFSLALAPKVSVGAAGELFVRHTDWKMNKVGYRYGLLLQPRPSVTVGICYADFPDRFPNDRVVLERLADETLNVGVSVVPVSWLRLALDVRNVSDEDKAAIREPHAGLEILPVAHAAIRTGFARSIDGERTIASLGVAALDLNRLIYSGRPEAVPGWGLEAGWIWERHFKSETRYFFLTCLIRIG